MGSYVTSPRGIGGGLGQLPTYNGYTGGGHSQRMADGPDFRVNVQDPLSPVHREIT